MYLPSPMLCLLFDVLSSLSARNYWAIIRQDQPYTLYGTYKILFFTQNWKGTTKLTFSVHVSIHVKQIEGPYSSDVKSNLETCWLVPFRLPPRGENAVSSQAYLPLSDIMGKCCGHYLLQPTTLKYKRDGKHVHLSGEEEALPHFPQSLLCDADIQVHSNMYTML